MGICDRINCVFIPVDACLVKTDYKKKFGIYSENQYFGFSNSVLSPIVAQKLETIGKKTQSFRIELSVANQWQKSWFASQTLRKILKFYPVALTYATSVAKNWFRRQNENSEKRLIELFWTDSKIPEVPFGQKFQNAEIYLHFRFGKQNFGKKSKNSCNYILPYLCFCNAYFWLVTRWLISENAKLATTSSLLWNTITPFSAKFSNFLKKLQNSTIL